MASNITFTPSGGSAIEIGDYGTMTQKVESGQKTYTVLAEVQKADHKDLRSYYDTLASSLQIGRYRVKNIPRALGVRIEADGGKKGTLAVDGVNYTDVIPASLDPEEINSPSGLGRFRVVFIGSL